MQLVLSHYQRDERVEQSVNRMMTIIDLARNIRERHNKALKTPLKYVQAPLKFCMCLFSMTCASFWLTIMKCKELAVVIITLTEFELFLHLVHVTGKRIVYL